ncbi:MAG: hypothetical protein ACREMW_11855 [Gemmatimonadales bacterium]
MTLTMTADGTRRRALGVVLALGFSVACSPPAHLAAQATPDTLPTGFGSLRRDDIVLRFTTDQVQLQILPVDEQVIRLLAPDTYRSLAQLIESRQADIADAAQRAGLSSYSLVLVTFFALVPGARFTPDDVQIQTGGRQLSPQGIVPLSPTWSTLQLDLKQQAVAIYLYAGGISWFEDLSASYQGPLGSWSRSVRLLQQERARVLARALSQPTSPNR